MNNTETQKESQWARKLAKTEVKKLAQNIIMLMKKLVE